jgi:hypothetical protein
MLVEIFSSIESTVVSLDNQSRYLTAIARLIESAYFNLGAVDRESQKIFDELANVLELKNKDTFSSQTFPL